MIAKKIVQALKHHTDMLVYNQQPVFVPDEKCKYT